MVKAKYILTTITHKVKGICQVTLFLENASINIEKYAINRNFGLHFRPRSIFPSTKWRSKFTQNATKKLTKCIYHVAFI